MLDGLGHVFYLSGSTCDYYAREQGIADVLYLMPYVGDNFLLACPDDVLQVVFRKGPVVADRYHLWVVAFHGHIGNTGLSLQALSLLELHLVGG